MTKTLGKIVGGVALCVLGVGCAGPRYIAASTASKGQVKFLHISNSGEQGVVKCDMADDGDLTNCRHVDIILEGG